MTATESRFRYQGETIEGEKVKGEIRAASANAARNELAVAGTRVHKISEKKGFNTEITKQKVPLVEVMHFSRQMATFLKAGVPVVESLETIRSGANNKRFEGVLEDVIARVEAGDTVAEAMNRNAEIFPPYFMALLRSSEYTGRMDESFDQLHAYIKRDIEIQRSVRKALIYPSILFVVAIGVTFLITVFVIPKFADFFADFDAELPLPTRMLMAVADFVGSPFAIVLGVLLVVSIVGIVAYFKTPSGRRVFHGILLRIPLISTVLVYSATERFTRVLAVLMDAGVAVSDAMPSAIECSNNLVFRERLALANEGVLAGQGFAGPLDHTELFPPTVVQMIRVGERTGELSDQLENVATFYEDELTYAVDKMTQWFEPMVLLFIGVVVGFVALAMVSAMYGLFNQVGV